MRNCFLRRVETKDVEGIDRVITRRQHICDKCARKGVQGRCDRNLYLYAAPVVQRRQSAKGTDNFLNPKTINNLILPHFLNNKQQTVTLQNCKG